VIVGAVWLVHRWRLPPGERRPRCCHPRTNPLRTSRFSGRSRLRRCAGASLRICADRAAQPSAARLDQQLRGTTVLSLQPAVVCGIVRLHLRAGAVRRPRARSDRTGTLRFDQQRSWRASSRRFAARLGDLRIGRHRLSVGLALGGTRRCGRTRLDCCVWAGLARRGGTARDSQSVSRKSLSLAYRRGDTSLLSGRRHRYSTVDG